VEITIGVQNVAREIVVDSDQSADEVAAAVSAALTGTSAVLDLTDSKGRRVLVPTASLAYVEVGAETKVRVGFGSI